MDATVCRAQLEKLLRDEATLLALLEGQLAVEHGLLTANDIDGLDQAGNARHDTVQRQMRVDDDPARRGIDPVHLMPDNFCERRFLAIPAVSHQQFLVRLAVHYP